MQKTRQKKSNIKKKKMQYQNNIKHIADEDYKWVSPLAKKIKENEPWDEQTEAEFIQKMVQKYDNQSSPYYSSARLWDDGVIDPAQTREVLGLALSIVLTSPIEDTHFGTFRM